MDEFAITMAVLAVLLALGVIAYISTNRCCGEIPLACKGPRNCLPDVTFHPDRQPQEFGGKARLLSAGEDHSLEPVIVDQLRDAHRGGAPKLPSLLPIVDIQENGMHGMPWSHRRSSWSHAALRRADLPPVMAPGPHAALAYEAAPPPPPPPDAPYHNRSLLRSMSLPLRSPWGGRIEVRRDRARLRVHPRLAGEMLPSQPEHAITPPAREGAAEMTDLTPESNLTPELAKELEEREAQLERERQQWEAWQRRRQRLRCSNAAHASARYRGEEGGESADSLVCAAVEEELTPAGLALPAAATERERIIRKQQVWLLDRESRMDRSAHLRLPKRPGSFSCGSRHWEHQQPSVTVHNSIVSK